jgi:hypothetical protein
MSNIVIKGRFQLSMLHLAYKIGKKLGKKDKEVTKFFLNQPVRTIPSLSDDIAQWIEQGKPMLLARLGGTEGVIAGQYCERQLKMRDNYSDEMLNWLFTTSGFFADDYDDKTQAVDQYAKLTIDGIPDCDYLSAMFPSKVYMPYFFKRFAKNAVPTFSDFGPYFDIETDKTWVRALKGKKVLVINLEVDSAHCFMNIVQAVNNLNYKEVMDYQITDNDTDFYENLVITDDLYKLDDIVKKIEDEKADVVFIDFVQNIE